MEFQSHMFMTAGIPENSGKFRVGLEFRGNYYLSDSSIREWERNYAEFQFRICQHPNSGENSGLWNSATLETQHTSYVVSGNRVPIRRLPDYPYWFV
jgi:hypothetical protein